MADEAKPSFEIHRLYVKDMSFESPRAPEVFKEKNKFKLDVHVDNNSKDLEGDFCEVSLKVTVTTKFEGKDEVVYVAETTYSGIFTLKDFSEEQKKQILNTACPNILFPYAREVLSSCVNRGGFPPLYLSPINFDAVYSQQQAKKADEAVPAKSDDGETKH